MIAQEEVLEKKLEEIVDQESNKIVLYNDDFNTFDHVINTLIISCEHTPHQAEQCALLVHYKGKCVVKSGSYDDLKPRCSKLHDAGLTAEII